METLLRQMNTNCSKMLLEYGERDPEILKSFFDGLGNKAKADLEMSKLVSDPLDERILKIACQNGLIYTLDCILEKGYELKDVHKKYIKKYIEEENDDRVKKWLLNK